MSEDAQKRANNSFSIDLLLLAGSALVHLCASGRVLHGVVGVLGLTEQVASPWEFECGEQQSARWSVKLREVAWDATVWRKREDGQESRAQ